MIEHLTHDRIDKAAWDARCKASANAHWYGLSSTLDAASPGWEALVDLDTGGQMPLMWRRKWGVRYLYQPFMLQHAGPWLRDEPEGAGRFLRAIPPQFRFADIRVEARELHSLPDFRFERCRNHVLGLGRPLATVRAGYSVNHRRSVRKAEKLGAIPLAAAPEEVERFLTGSAQFKEWGITAAQREAMHRVFKGTHAEGSGFGRVVRHGGATVAAAWFVKFDGTVIFLKGMANGPGRRVCAMHALMDGVIAEHCGRPGMLDFAGGQDADLARFYSGFGSEPRDYFRALMNRLPSLVRRLKA